MRIPKVQSLIKEVFGQDPGKRLNSEECVAKVLLLLLLFFVLFVCYNLRG